MAIDEIVTTLEFKEKGLKKVKGGVDKLGSSVKKLSAATEKSNGLLGKELSGKQKKLEKLQQEYMFTKKNESALKAFANASAISSSKTRKLQTSLDMQAGAMDASKNKTKALQKSMMGLGFSMLFGGMAMKRVFQSIATSGVAAFKRIIETTDTNSSAIQRLGVWWEYLKFTVGSAINRALEPLMPWLIRIISWASNFIQKHPETVFWALVAAVTAFTILMVGGQLVLAISAVIQVMAALGLSAGAAAAKLGLLMVRFVAVLVAAYLLKQAWDAMNNTNFKVFERLGGYMMALGLAIVVIGLAFGLWPLAAIGAIIAMIGYLVFFKDEIGNSLTLMGLVWDKFWFDVSMKAFNAFMKIANYAESKLSGLMEFVGIDPSKIFKDENDSEDKIRAYFKSYGDNIDSEIAKVSEKIANSQSPMEKIKAIYSGGAPNASASDGDLGSVLGVDVLKQLSSGVEDMTPAMSSVDDSMSTMLESTNTLGDGLGMFSEEALKPATDSIMDMAKSITDDGGMIPAFDSLVTEALPQLDTEVGNLTGTLDLQAEAFNDTAAAAERYNRSLKGATSKNG